MFIWFLRWTPFAIGERITPFFSDYLNHPGGINLMWNTWVPLPGLLLSPLTPAFGPVLSLNVLLTLAYGLSAWSAYLAIHRFVPSHGAAAAGGLVYGFSPSMIGHAHHPNLILVFLLPLLLVLVDEVLVRQRWSPVWLGVALGLVAAAQLLTGEELLVATGLISAALLVVLVAMFPRAVPGRVRYAVTAIAVSLLVFGPLVAWPVKAQLTGQARVQSDITPEVRGSSDLLAVVTPNRLSAIAERRHPPRRPLPGQQGDLPGDPDAAGGRGGGDRPTAGRVRPSGVRHAGGVPAALAGDQAADRWAGHRCGPAVGGDEALPLVQNMVPSRLALLTALFAGLLLAAALEGLWRRGGWLWRGLAVVTAVVVLAALAPRRRSGPARWWPRPRSSPAVRALPRDGVALVVPFPRRGRPNQAMVWQAEADMWFKMPGGYFVGPDPGGGTRHDAPRPPPR